MERVYLPRMRRYLQDPGACAFGSVASAANYYNRKIDYDLVCQLKKPDGEGLYTPEIALLLNEVGFTDVTVITADIDILDFCWKGLTKSKLIGQLKEARRRLPEQSLRDNARGYVKFLESNDDNKLVIDMRFGQHIRSALDEGIPVLASFNWNVFFGMPKENDSGKIDPIKGDAESHEIVINGYDDKGVMILDSHHESYKGRLSRYKSGRYRMDWETLMTVMGSGDLIIPRGFSAERASGLLTRSRK